VTAAAAGVETILLDTQPRPGGQYFREPSPGLIGPEDRRTRARDAVLRQLADSDVRTVCGAQVWGVFPSGDNSGWELAFQGPDGPDHVSARVLVLAAGACDRPIPFPGWTLPGVMTAGGVQAFLKGQGIVPGRRFLLSGTGPLQLAAAAELVRAGAEVVAVLEGAWGHLQVPGAKCQVPYERQVPRARFRPCRWHMELRTWRSALRHATALWGQWGRLAEGWGYARTLRSAKVQFRTGWSVVEARGAGRVEEAVICPLDEMWRPKREAAETVPVDTIAIGYGLMPCTELSQLAGCRHEHRPDAGGYAPRRDARMETTVPGVYAIGDGAGIGGAELAQIEGRIAGAAVAARLGRLPESATQAAIAREQPALVRQQRFARMLSAWFTPGAGLYGLAADDTIICRCEEVTLGEIRRAVAEGAVTANEVKGLTRAGMGNCQGRICGELAPRIIVAETGGRADDVAAIEAAGRFTARPPLHPLTLADLARIDTGS
jgi:NADPH-dependent 2,4-dienoyl-CoA reductase/sulfur reductase-like enzyme